MARNAHFLVRCAGAGPGCGSLRYRCDVSDPPAVKHWLRITGALLVAVEDQRPPLVATCHIAHVSIEARRTSRRSRIQYHTGRIKISALTVPALPAQ
jgi:hypothetical protein